VDREASPVPDRSSGVARCGHVALAGRPNVGKSTLMNHLLGRKLSITSRKPQTTRHALIGVLTEGCAQIVFVDTPGVHVADGRALNRYMVRQALTTLSEVDLVLFLVDAQGWRRGDETVLRRIEESRTPCVCVINKIDRLDDKQRLLPLIDRLRKLLDFEAIVPVSALRNIALEELTGVIVDGLPEGGHLFPDDAVTDRPLEFLIAETVREKATRRLGAELPHQTAVVVERLVAADGCTEIDAVLYVERETQKGIVVGKGGSMLKSIGEDARKDIERLIGGKAMVRLWVKVDRRWSDRADALRRFGYR